MDDEELRVMTRIIEDLFRLDDALRTRLAAHIEWLHRHSQTRSPSLVSFTHRSNPMILAGSGDCWSPSPPLMAP